MKEKYIEVLLKEAKKSLKTNDVPVSALILNNGNIIGKSHNQRELKQQISKHAEIIVIDKVCKKQKTWHLDDMILITTLEPCLMCAGAIIQSRIKKVFYLVINDKYGSSDVLKQNGIEVEYVSNDDAKQLIQEFFKKKRK